MTRLAAVVAAALLLQACVPAEKPKVAAPPVAASRLIQAEQALAEGRIEDARRNFVVVVAAEPDNARARLGLAESLLAAGDASEALKLFSDLAAVADPEPRALVGKGVALVRLRRNDEAMAPLQAAVARDPSLWRGWNALGIIHDGRREWPLAAVAYDQALAVSPGNPAVLNNRGFSLLLQRRYETAAERFAEAVRGNPSLSAADANLRLSLAYRGLYQDALAGVPPERLPIVFNNVGYAALQRGDRRAAREFLRRAQDTSPTYNRVAAENLRSLAGDGLAPP